ncbi:MAG: cytochrome c oxidase subunit 3 [Parvibaculaceae bacterium]
METSEEVGSRPLDNEFPDTSRRLPGEEGVWIIIFGDMCLFALFFGVFLYYRALDVETYRQAQALLDERVGLLNTIVLLVSSWFVVFAVALARNCAFAAARKIILAACLFGLLFVVLKGLEYAAHFGSGHTLISNEFFMFYFMYTGIHLVHVLIGLGALAYTYSRLGTDQDRQGQHTELLESSGSFWHLVDLLWVVLFALLYLVK